MIIAAGLLIALAAVLLVLEPVLRGVGPAHASSLLPDSDDDEIDPVQRRRDLALAALKEIEFDQATGKLSDEDYDRLRSRYSAEAVEAIKAAEAAADPVERLIAAARARREGGPAPTRAGGRKFCTECGVPVAGAGKFCLECGSRIPVG